MCYEEKSVFYALKWLLLEIILFFSLSKKNITCPLCSENSLLRVLSKKLSSPFLCSTILYDSPLFFFYGISCFFFLMHMDIESACMWLTLETSLRCSRVLFGKWSSMLTFLSKQKKTLTEPTICMLCTKWPLPSFFIFNNINLLSIIAQVSYKIQNKVEVRNHIIGNRIKSNHIATKIWDVNSWN